jgi:hypothetical protein
MERAEFIQLMDGNPGAAHFLTTLMGLPLEKQEVILGKIREGKIKGTDLWVLFSDLCQKDYEKVVLLCEKCPTSVLADACSRQDYSGRELVSQYLT